MIRRIAATVFLLIPAFFGAIATAQSTTAPTKSLVPDGYVMVFSDEMNEPSLDVSKWWTRYIYEGGMLDTLNDERQLYRENNNHVMTGTALDLTARKVPTARPRFQYESGMIRSKKTFRFGYFEARVKCPGGRGVWPAFWLNSDADANGKSSWPPELDILEYPCNNADCKPNTVHITTQGGPKQKGAPNPFETQVLSSNENFKKNYYHAPFNFSDNYHVFATLWKDDNTFEVFIDGISVVKYHYKWVYNTGGEAPNAHLLLNLAIGGNWAGKNGIDDAAFPQAFSIDYVRVYQKKGAENVGTNNIGKDLLRPTVPAGK